MRINAICNQTKETTYRILKKKKTQRERDENNLRHLLRKLLIKMQKLASLNPSINLGRIIHSYIYILHTYIA